MWAERGLLPPWRAMASWTWARRVENSSRSSAGTSSSWADPFLISPQVSSSRELNS